MWMYVHSLCLFYGDGDSRNIHVQTHSFPTRRTADLCGANLGGRRAAVRIAEMAEAREREVGAVLAQLRVRRARGQDFLQAMAGRAAEDDEVDQAVRAEAVRAMHRHARRFADREQADRKSTRLNSSH